MDKSVTFNWRYSKPTVQPTSEADSLPSLSTPRPTSAQGHPKEDCESQKACVWLHGKACLEHDNHLQLSSEHLLQSPTVLPQRPSESARYHSEALQSHRTQKNEQQNNRRVILFRAGAPCSEEAAGVLGSGSLGALSDSPAHSSLKGSHLSSDTFREGLTIPTCMFEIPILPSSVINEDHEDESQPAKQERAHFQGTHR